MSLSKIVAALASAVALGAVAQHAPGHAAHHGGGYAAMQDREIKALSPEQIAELRQGRGMGASLPAELNGVPGPLHVLELAERLEISPSQRTALERITADMGASARRLGEQLIAAEAALDASFRSGSADERSIVDATARIGALQAQLRAVHLVAHLQTRRLLSDPQVAAYNAARGYAAVPSARDRHRH